MIRVLEKRVVRREVLACGGLTRRLQLMDMAIGLRTDASTKFHHLEYDRDYAPSPAPIATAKGGAERNPLARVQEITFRSIVEDYAVTHSLIFSTGCVRERERVPLFRVSLTTDGKGGIRVDVLDASSGRQTRGDNIEPSCEGR